MKPLLISYSAFSMKETIKSNAEIIMLSKNKAGSFSLISKVCNS